MAELPHELIVRRHDVTQLEGRGAIVGGAADGNTQERAAVRGAVGLGQVAVHLELRLLRRGGSRQGQGNEDEAGAEDATQSVSPIE